jgi:uncharacterized protein YbjT (DUF2867 family)
VNPPTASGSGPERVPLDFDDSSTFPAAVAGCRALFLLRPPAISDTRSTLNALVDAAREAGISQVVFLSVAGAADHPFVPHHAVETHLRGAGSPAGTPWTILRPGFFAQNLETAYREDIVEDNRILVPAGGGSVAFVDLRDVGEVAARALMEPEEHAGATYTLTGPEAFTFQEVAEMMSRVVGRRIRYRRASALGYLLHLLRAGTGPAQAAVQTALHVGLRFGQAEEVDPTLGRLLDGRPRGLLDYLRDHAHLWRRS